MFASILSNPIRRKRKGLREENMDAQLIKSAKIIIVDDEPDNVVLLEKMLRVWGYSNLITTTDSREVVDLFRKHRPDFVFLDLMMPNIDGFTILEELQAEIGEHYMPIVVLTADASQQTKRRALAAGAKDFLTKPYDPFEVLLRLENLLETRFLYLALENQKAALEAALGRQ